MKLKKFFGDGMFWKGALQLALPISLQNILISSFALVDTIMVGALGGTALAAVGMAGQWSFLLNLVLFGFNSGASVFIAQYWGVKDEANIRKSFGLATLSAIAASTLFMAVGLTAPYFVIGFFTQDAVTIELGVSYLRIAAFSYLAIGLNNLLATLLRSTEDARLPLYASAVSVAANAAFNALFIYGMEMGVRGAALATAISSWISPVLLFILSMRKKNILFAPVKSFFGWKKEFVLKYFAISIPVLLNETMWALGTVLYKAIFSNASSEFYAAYTVFSSIEGLAFAFFVGLCHASAVMVGKKVGAGEFDEAYLYGCRFSFSMPILSLFVGLILILVRPIVLMPFANVGEEMLRTASTIILIYSLEIALRNIPYITIVGAFRSGGDTKIGLLYDLSCLWGVALPVTWIGANVLHMPLTMVFLMMLLCEDLVKGMLCIRRLLSRKWIRPVTDESARQKAGAAEADGPAV
ncbi:MAG: MATE family efflux transporter [Clostridia bacterium]|nr:MATE family efflux transporter [Clostridia bacterium]